MSARTELMSLVSGVPDPATRTFVALALENAPAHFWTMSASKKFHHEDERGQQGLVIHTIRVVRVGILLCDSRPDLDPNVVIPACFLHDVCRFGLTDAVDFDAYTQHPKLASDFARPFGSMLQNGRLGHICGAVETHMGKWFVKHGVPAPRTEDEWAVHYADNVAANIQMGVR